MACALHQPVGVFAQHAGFGQIEQQLAAEDQPAGAFEILLHPLGIDQQAVDQVGGLRQQIVHQNRRIGKDDPLDRRVRDVALVPQRDVFKGRLRIAAQHARQAADLFAGDGILLVRHGRRALLLFAEVLLRLAHLGPLQVAHFDGDLVERAADNRQRGDVGRVPVALDDLRGHRRRLQAQPRADALFVLGLQVAKGADGAGELAHAHVFGRRVEAGQVALHLGVPVQQLEAEGGRLGVNAVGAADGGRVLELEGATS